MEKFKVIFNSERVLGLKNCPVQVEKYNILFNNSTERNVIQLKLRNRAEKTVKSVYLEIDCFDDTKDNLGTLKDIVYLNVNAAQGKTFGDRQAVNTDFSIVSSINIKITKVAFDDETIWRNEAEAYLHEFPQPANGSAYFGELYGQYKREAEKINADVAYAYSEKEDFWQCSCGQNNDYENMFCFACHTDRNKLKAISDLQYLSEENQKYLIAEEQERQRLEAERLAEEAERHRIEEEQRKEAEEKAKQQQEAKEKLKKRLIKISIPTFIIICVLIVGTCVVSYVTKINNYNKAIALEEQGDYCAALSLLMKLNTDKAVEEILSIEKKLYLKTNTVIDGNYYHTVGLKNDGTVVAIGDDHYGQCEVESWNDITAISVGNKHTIGLKKDKTVVAVGDSHLGQCDVKSWNNIIAISAGTSYTIGLREDGTVVATGYNPYGQCDVEDWNDIIAVYTGDYHTVGLKEDGTVVATGYNDYGQCDVKNWNNIIAVSVGASHTVGLKNDGTVIATGSNRYGQCDVESWNDIVAVFAGGYETVGLKSDGTVVATGSNRNGQCNVNEWTDIIAISVGSSYVIGLKNDGTFVVTGDNSYGQCNVSDWEDIMIY